MRPRSNSSKSFSTANSVEGQKIKIKPRNKILPPNHASLQDKCLHYVVIVLLLLVTSVILFGELLLLPKNEAAWCRHVQQQILRKTPIRQQRLQSTMNTQTVSIVNRNNKYENPDFNPNPCLSEHPPHLLFLSRNECDWGRRMLLSVALGAVVGFERKSADRPAGIRTMSLVSLGSCFFTICSMVAFRYTTTMTWDAARVTAAVPSGVGFLGAGLIWKGTIDAGTPRERQEVHGLTTAASVWLSAAIGVGCGGELYIVSIYATALVIFVLRLGPRLYLADPNPLSSSSLDHVYDSYNDLHPPYESKSEQKPEKLNETMADSVPSTIHSFPDETLDVRPVEGHGSTNTNTMRRCYSQVDAAFPDVNAQTPPDNPPWTFPNVSTSQQLRRIQSDAALFSTPVGDSSRNISRSQFSHGPTFVN